MNHRSLGIALLPLLAGCSLGLSAWKDSGDTGRIGQIDDEGGGGGSGSSDTGFGSGDGGDDGEDCVDADGDGIDTCNDDCDDSDPATHPGAAENDSTLACMRDADGDGWGDADATSPIVPGTDCDDSTLTLQQNDDDNDGASTCDGDCDDRDPSRAPGFPETPFDGVDSDCDGEDGGAIISASGSGGRPINDNSTTTSSATVSGCGTVQSVEVSVDISHTYQGDLTVELRGPSGVSATLHDRSGSGTDDIVGTYATSGGSITPVDSLYVFTNENGDGIWTLEIEDHAFVDTGTLNAWSITLYCSG